MALTVQTDDGLTAGANSYADLTYFKTYHTDRLNDYSAYTDTQISAGLIKAQAYMDFRFEYIGFRLLRTQTTEWPRQNAWDDRDTYQVGVPDLVKQAQCEYAIRACAAALAPDPTQEDSGRTPKRTVDRIGPLEQIREYDAWEAYGLPPYPVADHLLKMRGLVVYRGNSSFGVGQTVRG